MRLDQIDGLRFWACMVVVASHVGVFGLWGQGGIIVSLFFVLSGFFISKPLKPDGEEDFLSVRGWGSFYLSRIVRIIPIHWSSLLLTYWLFPNAFTFERILRNMFFLEGWAHLWFLSHEVLCYILAPAAMAAAALMKRYFKVKNIWLGAGFFVLSVLLHIYFYNITAFRVVGQPFRIDLFILGIAFCYLYKSGVLQVIHRRPLSLTADLLSILLILAVHFSGCRILARISPALSEYMIGWERPWLCGFLGGILILLVALNPGGIVSRVFSFPWFVQMGRASYGIYIIHYYYFIIYPQPLATPMRNFIVDSLFSCCVSLVFFRWVEEPLYRLVKKRRKNIYRPEKNFL